MNVEQLALASFGLIVPTTLHDVHPFDVCSLEEDALLRVDVVNDKDQKVLFSDHYGDQTWMSFDDLETYHAELLPNWRKLEPTYVPVDE